MYKCLSCVCDHYEPLLSNYTKLNIVYHRLYFCPTKYYISEQKDQPEYSAVCLPIVITVVTH
jgi:hypothetical protein